MKAITKIALSALLVLATTSCNSKKDWWCICKNDTYNVTEEHQLESMKKSMAKEKCDAYNREVSGSNGVVSHMVCTLD